MCTQQGQEEIGFLVTQVLPKEGCRYSFPLGQEFEEIQEKYFTLFGALFFEEVN